MILMSGGVIGGGGGGSGDVGYVNGAGGPLNEDGYSIATFADGSCVVTGAFAGTCTWGLGVSGQTSWTTAGERDIFVAL